MYSQGYISLPMRQAAPYHLNLLLLKVCGISPPEIRWSPESRAAGSSRLSVRDAENWIQALEASERAAEKIFIS